MKNNTSGFTLIELLVVVLIIGILSSVALPQYQKAVEKSRVTEAMVFADAWLKGQQLYHMANGSFGNNDFDISLPTLKHYKREAAGKVLILWRIGPFGQYDLQTRINWDETNNKYIIQRYCTGNEKMCKAISNGATCSNKGEDGDVPWCYCPSSADCIWE